MITTGTQMGQGPVGAAGSTGATGSAGASFNIQAPVSQSYSSGTAFQPRSGGPCILGVQAAITGTVGVTGKVVVSMCATSGGSYTTCGTAAVLVGVLTVDGEAYVIVPVPTGYYVKITNNGSATSTAVRWDL